MKGPSTRATSIVPALPPSPKLGNPFMRHLGLPDDSSVCDLDHTIENTTLDVDCARFDSDDEQNYTTRTGTLTKHIESRLDELKISHFQKRFHGKVSASQGSVSMQCPSFLSPLLHRDRRSGMLTRSSHSHRYPPYSLLASRSFK